MRFKVFILLTFALASLAQGKSILDINEIVHESGTPDTCAAVETCAPPYTVEVKSTSELECFSSSVLKYGETSLPNAKALALKVFKTKQPFYYTHDLDEKSKLDCARKFGSPTKLYVHKVLIWGERDKNACVIYRLDTSDPTDLLLSDMY